MKRKYPEKHQVPFGEKFKAPMLFKETGNQGRSHWVIEPCKGCPTVGPLNLKNGFPGHWNSGFAKVLG